MRNISVKIITLIVAVAMMATMLVGCASPVYDSGNLTYRMSVAKVTGTESDPISMIDHRTDTRWKGDASGDVPVVAIFNFSEPTTFNKIAIDEDGHKITKMRIEIMSDGGSWIPIVGSYELPENSTFIFSPVTTSQLKMVIEDSDYKFAIREIGVYYEEFLEQ